MANAELLIVSEAAQILGLSVRRVQQLADEGKLPVQRTKSGVRLFRLADVNREIARREKADRDERKRASV